MAYDNPAVDADREGAIGDQQRRPIGGTVLDKGPWLLTPLGFPARGDRERMMLHGLAIPGRLYREHVCEGLHDEAIGDEGGPCGLHVHSSGAVGSVRRAVSGRHVVGTRRW